VSRKFLFSILLSIASCGGAGRRVNGVLGAHDMTPLGKSPIKGRVAGACLFACAALRYGCPMTPLWNQQLHADVRELLGTTYHQTGLQPPLGSPTKLCLSCHAARSRRDRTMLRQVDYDGSMKATSNSRLPAQFASVSMKTP